MFVWILAACRPELEAPVYPEFEPWVDDKNPFLPGADPFEAGDERLTIGVYYEGEATEAVEIDDVVTHYYVYEGTYGEQPSEDRIEGLESTALVPTGAQLWWGGGIHWDAARDLTEWSTYRLSFRSDNEGFASFDIGITGGTEGRVTATDYGFVADGEWHSLVIPLADFAAAGADLSAVTVALVLAGETAVEGAELYVDDVYLTKE